MALGLRRHALRRIDAAQAMSTRSSCSRAAPARVTTVASGLTRPIGVAFRDGALYVSAIDRILRFDDIEHRLDEPPKPVWSARASRTSADHGGKFIAFGPDGKLYVPSRRAVQHLRARPRSLRQSHAHESRRIGARGLRARHPQHRRLRLGSATRRRSGSPTTAATCWATTLPPDELNHAAQSRAALRLSVLPRRHDRRPGVRPQASCGEFAPPAQNLGPHVASLGMRFYTGAQFPAAIATQIFIAEHGSWNRSQKIGYRVSVVRIEGGKAVSYEPFADRLAAGRAGVGPPGRRARHAGRLTAGFRRFRRSDLPHQLRRDSLAPAVVGAPVRGRR